MMSYAGDSYGGQYGSSGGNSYANAGGFVANQGPTFNSDATTGTTDSPTRKGKGFGNKSLYPVTIRQLHHTTQASSDDSFRIDGQDLTTVTFVGVIRNVTESATSIMYTIEDGTGKIDVRKWFNRDEDSTNMQKRSNLREGVYVHVFGELRAFQDQKSITGIHIRPLEDFNEITYHMLEAIYLHIFHTRGQKNQSTQKFAFGLRNSNTATPSFTGDKPTANSYIANKTSTTDSYHSYDSEFTPLQSKVMNVIRATNAPEGAKVASIVQQLQGKANEIQIRSAIDWLCGEGHLYSTIDEEHYKFTGA